MPTDYIPTNTAYCFNVEIETLRWREHPNINPINMPLQGSSLSRSSIFQVVNNTTNLEMKVKCRNYVVHLTELKLANEDNEQYIPSPTVPPFYLRQCGIKAAPK